MKRINVAYELLRDPAARAAYDRDAARVRELDARGLNCPLPILRTKKSLTDMTSGQILKILATDPGSTKDFQAFAKQTGNVLLSADESDKVFTFLMQKK